jgi:DNA repair protein RadC
VNYPHSTQTIPQTTLEARFETINRFQLRVTRVAVGEDVAPYGRLLNSSEEVGRLAKSLIGSASAEVLLAFHLSSRLTVTGFTEVARGGVNACSACPREIFRAAIVDGAHAIVLAHNHPSGDASPSSADVEITKRVKKAGALLGIQLLDHVIVAAGGQMYSFEADQSL